MKTLHQRLLGFFLALGIVCTLLPVPAAASEEFAGLQGSGSIYELQFSTDSTYPWSADSAIQNKAAYKSGNFLRNESASTLTAQITGPCWITFEYAYSSETDYDFFRLTLDGEEVEFDGSYTYTDDNGERVTTPGKTGDPGVMDPSELQWRFGQVGVTGEGDHTLVWSFVKDQYTRGGLDAAWVANVRALSAEDVETVHPAYEPLELKYPSISVCYDENGGSVTAESEYGVEGELAPYTIYHFNAWSSDADENRPDVTLTATPKEGYLFSGWSSYDGEEKFETL